MYVGSYAPLRVVAVQDDGAWLAWASKKLFLPRREEVGQVQRGSVVVVFIALDQGDRPYASMRLEEFLEHDPSILEPGQKVDLLVIGESDLGFKAIINHEHLGILYYNEVFQPLAYGDEVVGYVKKIRDDGKVDLILQPTGTKGSPELGQRILDRLEAEGGFLALTDKSPAEMIYDLFGVSKKKYKVALGGLYKNRQVTLHDDGIRRAQR
jgi:predicted RNA-binding protein (virulence factor B family)